MPLLDEESPSPRRSLLPWAVLVVAVLGAAGAAVWWWTVCCDGERPPVARAPARDEAPARPAPERPAAKPEREPRRRAEPSPAPAAPEPVAPTVEAKPSGVLRVRSDVAGASVFLDRKFLGTTPLEVDGLVPGPHRLNVSAEGYDGHAQQVEIGDGPAEVDVRFREVRLDVAIPVVHKHGVGSCSGRLVASTSGLRYETTNKGDAFTLAFADLDGFEVDYLKKNLRVKRRGGKTWNFEDPAGNADNLFVFHRDVDKARVRLAR